MGDHQLFGDSISSNGGQNTYVFYPGASRILTIHARDAFGQIPHGIASKISWKVFFSCNPETPCENLEIVQSEEDPKSISSFMSNTDSGGTISVIQIRFEMKGSESALLKTPIPITIRLAFASKDFSYSIHWRSLPLTGIVSACGAGFGEVSYLEKLGKPEHSMEFAVQNETKFVSSLESNNGAQPSLNVKHICKLCPMNYYSLNGTCASCAYDGAIDFCSGPTISAPATWWVMTVPSLNRYESLRCAESFCGPSNQCIFHRKGTLCGKCVQGKATSLTSLCLDCTGFNWTLFVFAIFLTWVAVLILHAMVSVSSGKATILIFFVQTGFVLRSQIPVISRQVELLDQYPGLYSFVSWLLCIWPMNYLERSLLFAIVPFIMMIEISVTFGIYYLARFIWMKIKPSKGEHEYDKITEESELRRSLLKGESHVGYGPELDALEEIDEYITNGSATHTEDDDSSSIVRETKSLLGEDTSDEDVGLLNLQNDSNTSLLDEGDELGSENLTREEMPFLEEQHFQAQRLWQTQNSFFHHYRLIRTCLSLFSNTFSSTLGVVVSTVGCVKLLDGSNLLIASPSISCDSKQYRLIQTLYWLFIPYLLFVAGIMFGKLLHSYLTNTLSLTDVRFGVWYEMFKPRLFAWKISEFLRRALIYSISNLLITHRVKQAAIVTTIILASLAVHMTAYPYRAKLENWLETLSLASLAFMSSMLLWNDLQTTNRPFVTTLTLAVLIVVAIILTSSFTLKPIAALRRRWKSRKERKHEKT